MDLAHLAQRKQLVIIFSLSVCIIKYKIMQGTRDSFGLPLTVTPMIENKLKTALYIFPQVGAPWLFFLRYERHRMIRGENNCAQHRSKAQHWTQTKGNKHPRCFAKAQRTTREGGKKKKCSSMRRLGIFSSTRSAHDSD